MVRVIKKKDKLPQIQFGDRSWEKRNLGGGRFIYVSIEIDDGEKYDGEGVSWDGRSLLIETTCACRENIEIPKQMLEEFLASTGYKLVPITEEATPDVSGG